MFNKEMLFDRQTIIIFSIVLGLLLFPIFMFLAEKILVLGGFSSSDYIAYRVIVVVQLSIYILSVRKFIKIKFSQKDSS